MIRLSPGATLAVLLTAAAALLVIGIGVARQETSVRLERDRAPARRFCDDLQHELHRLERTYEGRLQRLARTVPLVDRQEIWRACDQIVGVRQWSLIHSARDHALDWHLPIETSPAALLPEPTLATETPGLPRPRVQLSETELRNGADDSGWVNEPGAPLLFWLRRPVDDYVVLLIDEAAVASAFDGWISDWTSKAFAPVRAAGGPDQLFAPGDRLVATAGTPTSERPDFLLPIRTRFGVWQHASWDRRETRVHYHVPALAGSSTVAVLVALLGVVISTQQRRTLRHAEERVSFVNAVSHELRVPLTNILLNIDLASDLLQGLQSEADRRLSLVHEEAQRLARLIDNVLTFSMRERRAPNLRAGVPASIIRAVAAQFAPSFTRRALVVAYQAEVGEARLLDADALSQIVANLLSNIEKYVPGGRVEIVSHLESGILRITIRDEGSGIPPGDAERIFLPFERLDSRVTEGASGTGLGLAISRELARQLGGTLRLLPTGSGSTFELHIPAPPAPQLRACDAA